MPKSEVCAIVNGLGCLGFFPSLVAVMVCHIFNQDQKQWPLWLSNVHAVLVFILLVSIAMIVIGGFLAGEFYSKELDDYYKRKAAGEDVPDRAPYPPIT